MKGENKYSLAVLIFTLLISSVACAQGDIKDMFTKKEVKIEMRDGVKLFTSIYLPKDNSEQHPILLWRTPYSVAPYSEDKISRRLNSYKHFVNDGYIIVLQDVRGKFMSEGEFVDMRPFIPNKTSMQTDEASDTYDTVEWLINNIENNNGKVGIWGISYPGFYAAMAAMSGHPAIKAISPQAPIADWFKADDMHHNGALTLLLSYNFFKVFGQPRDSLTTRWTPGPKYDSPDAYSFFLNIGPIKNLDKKYLKGKIQFWNQVMENGNYNDFWKSRSTLNHFENVNMPIMTVGGWYDGEDLFGSLNTYRAIENKNPENYNTIVMGPWTHGAWARGDVSDYGALKFSKNESEFYRKNVESKFFNHFLKGEELELPEALMFETGTNVWKEFKSWPPEDSTPLKLFLGQNNSLNFSDAELAEELHLEEYISNPDKPVPYTAKIMDSGRFYNKSYMNEDQRFASRRPDVLAFESKELTEEFTIAGPIDVEFYVSTSSTDADWIAKIIDVYPDSARNPDPNPNGFEMGGFEMMLRAEILRGKFRNSLENPEPFVPNEITKVKFRLQDILHTFKKGHKIMIQIQSSWFPLFDRNPQTFCDIYNADEKDFVKAVHKVYFSKRYPSHIEVNELK